MNDNRDDREVFEDLGELLSLADQPVHFPEAALVELLDHVIRTESIPRVEGTTIFRSATISLAKKPAHPSWTLGVAESIVVLL